MGIINKWLETKALSSNLPSVAKLLPFLNVYDTIKVKVSFVIAFIYNILMRYIDI